MKVLKFGGSSVAKPKRILQIIDILKDYEAKGEKFAVVFSAFGGVTDYLIDMCELAEKGDDSYKEKIQAFKQRHLEAVDELMTVENKQKMMSDILENHNHLENLLEGIKLLGEASDRTMDHVLSFGERNSAYIISHAMRQRGLDCHYLDARKVICTDSQFRAAKVDFDTTNEYIQGHFHSRKDIAVITGFVAKNANGVTTTLGRGGSDYTCAIFAAALQAEAIEIWTDVNGVMTADPRKVPNAFTIPSMTYAEAMEMSHFGAKVIYPPTIQPALQKNIPLYIKNTFEPEFKGTLVSHEADDGKNPIKGVTSIQEVTLLTLQGSGMMGVPGSSARLFGSLGRAKVNIILITQGSSEHSITFAIDPKQTPKALETLNEEFINEMQQGLINPVKVENDLCTVAVVGENMKAQPGVAGHMFNALGKNGVNIVAIAQGSSELNISTVIKREDEEKALNAMHEAFFLSDTKVLHVFMVGVGLIGSTLLEQIQAQNKILRERQSLEIKIVGLSNSRKMLFDKNGLDLSNWKENLLVNGTPRETLEDFIGEMKSLNLRNSIFIDNTASADVAKHYASILDASISISTPNKVAASANYTSYKSLKDLAKKRNVEFVFETNVGAGLPVISTLENLTSSGDVITQIEGVLSGSLSFIFNTFKSGASFSDVVREAKSAGFTEPDPREDLSGKDVQRKILILSREAGYPLEMEDITIEPLLPKPCMEARSVDDFFVELDKANDYFSNLLAEAEAKQHKLRFVASMIDGKATISLKSVDASHPFYGLSGSDNIVVFTTERYSNTPMVIRGPGAGAAVTAAGVFAEIITIGNRLFE